MNEFWEARYGSEVYAYGTEPNEYLRQQLTKIPVGRILFPAEGEGRNAVYAAREGFEVHAFDFSTEGRKKALALASGYDVQLSYLISTYEEADFPADYFDAVALIFAHMHPSNRQRWHRKLAGFLKPGGSLIIEGFATDQPSYGTGGPPDVDMLYTPDLLRMDFSGLTMVEVEKKEVTLNEGPYHKGLASLVRGVFRK